MTEPQPVTLGESLPPQPAYNMERRGGRRPGAGKKPKAKRQRMDTSEDKRKFLAGKRRGGQMDDDDAVLGEAMEVRRREEASLGGDSEDGYSNSEDAGSSASGSGSEVEDTESSDHVQKHSRCRDGCCGEPRDPVLERARREAGLSEEIDEDEDEWGGSNEDGDVDGDAEEDDDADMEEEDDRVAAGSEEKGKGKEKETKRTLNIQVRVETLVFCLCDAYFFSFTSVWNRSFNNIRTSAIRSIKMSSK